jgi:hypothetical protein
MMNNTDYNLIAFKAISDFVKELGDNFGDKVHGSRGEILNFIDKKIID